MRISDWSSDVCSSDLSPGLQNDDRRLPRLDGYKGRVVVATEKMDGEGSTLTREKTYPRSPDGRPHPSRSWIKAYHAHKAQQIPVNWRISGEGMYAIHSIPYTAANQNALRSYFYGFGVWDENNTRSEEHTSELQSLMRTSYTVFCLKKQKNYLT